MQSAGHRPLRLPNLGTSVFTCDGAHNTTFAVLEDFQAAFPGLHNACEPQGLPRPVASTCHAAIVRGGSVNNFPLFLGPQTANRFSAHCLSHRVQPSTHPNRPDVHDGVRLARLYSVRL